MFYKGLIFMLFLGFLSGAELIEPNQTIYDQSVEFGFESEILEAPMPKKSRVYVLRARDFVGEKLNLKIFYQYKPEILANSKGILEPVFDKNALSYIDTLANADGFFMDFDADKPLLLMSEIEKKSYLIFTPKANKIYCVKGSVILGLHNGRPNLKLVKKELCEEIFEEISR